MNLRILFCGSFGSRTLQTPYYNTDHKLRNGLVRAGHQVLALDERERFRAHARVGLAPLGRQGLRAELLAMATHFRPHAVFFGHSDRLPNDTHDALRKLLPGVRLATFFGDHFGIRPVAASRSRARAVHMDAVFTTTADAAAIAPHAARRDLYWYFPNPVDAGIETRRTDELARDALAADGIFLGSEIGTRAAQIAALREHLPEPYRLHVGGRREGGERLQSTTFLDTLATGGACPQLPVDDTLDPPTPRLCTSARIAQTIGQGVVALTPAAGGFEQLYDDGIVAFTSRADLAAKMAALALDDERRRTIGARGRLLAHSRTNGTRIARYMVDTLFERPYAEAYEWPSDPVY